MGGKRRGVYISELEHRVIGVLKKTETMSARELSDEMKVPVTTIYAACRHLVQNGRLRKLPNTIPDRHGTNPRGFVYALVYASTKLEQEQDDKIAVAAKIEVNSLQSEAIERLLVKWAENKWEPKIFQSARGLPLGLARLYELAIEMSLGSVVTQGSLDAVRQDLQAFSQDLRNTLTVVEGFLSTKELYILDELPAFLLTSDDSDRISRLAFKAKQVN